MADMLFSCQPDYNQNPKILLFLNVFQFLWEQVLTFYLLVIKRFMHYFYCQKYFWRAKKKNGSRTGNRKVEADVFLLFILSFFWQRIASGKKKCFKNQFWRQNFAKNLKKWELKPEMLAFCFAIPIQRF